MDRKCTPTGPHHNSEQISLGGGMGGLQLSPFWVFLYLGLTSKKGFSKEA